MSEIHPSDIEMLVQRYVDGELSDLESAAFEQRLAAEPDLQCAADEARGYVGMFAAEHSVAVPEPSDSFQSRVIEAARRLPVEDGDSNEVEQAEVQLLVRRILVAAVALFSLGLLVYAGLLRQTDASDLIAAPDEIRSEMQRLDDEVLARIKAAGDLSTKVGAAGREKTK